MIFFLYGEDTFRSQEKLDEIKQKFLANNPTGSGLSVFDFQEEKNKLSFSRVSESLGARGLFSQKQLIIIKHFLKNSLKDETEKALNFFAGQKDIFENKDAVLIFLEAGLGKKKNALQELLLKQAKKQEFPALSGIKLLSWIGERVKKSGMPVEISKKAGEKLIAFAGADLQLLSLEIEKLAIFKESGIIEEQDVDALVSAKATADIFATIEAVTGGNKKSALAKFHSQLEKGDDAHYVFSMYVYQFRNLLKISEFFDNGMRNNYEIAKLAGLHPFVVQKALSQIGRWGSGKIKEAYEKLAKIDADAKTGKVDMETALDKFILEI